MNTNTIKTYGPLVIVAFAVLMAYGISSTKAEEPCKTPEALSHLANVKQNQPRIAENKDEYDRLSASFNSRKEISPDDLDGYNEYVRNLQWNASEDAAAHKLGCRIDWDNLVLVPLQ